MPITKSATKAARQSVKRTEHNKQIKKDIKGAVKAFRANPSLKALAKAQSEFDKAVKKGLIKKNTASRRKSGLARLMKAAGISMAEAGAKKTTKATADKKAPAKTAAKEATAKKPATKTTSKAAKAEEK